MAEDIQVRDLFTKLMMIRSESMGSLGKISGSATLLKDNPKLTEDDLRFIDIILDEVGKLSKFIEEVTKDEDLMRANRSG